jgi:hypothetical protein
MNRRAQDSIEGRVRDVQGNLNREAGRDVVHPPLGANAGGQQRAGDVQQRIGRIRGILEDRLSSPGPANQWEC